MTHRTKPDPLLSLTQSFFRDYLERTRGVSPHTVRAYRDTLKLFFEFLSGLTGRTIAQLRLEDVTSDTVKSFLTHLESKRANSRATRNCRFTALRSFCKHLLRNDIGRAAFYSQILALKPKKAPIAPATYLEPEEMSSILEQPDRRTLLGARDHALLLFMYNTGARVSEALAVRPQDFSLIRPKQVRLYGKNRKERVIPLWNATATALQRLAGVQHCEPGERLFRNRRGEPLTRNGVDHILSKYVALAARKVPALRRRNITPHVLRHSSAAGLLQGGNDPTVIRDYLGHSSVATTNRYITSNLQMKRDALELFWRRAGLSPKRAGPWKPKPDLLAFLGSL
jgi:site-specific recombinase XerD